MAELSDYERIRLENIQRNNAFLAELGLDGVKLDKKAENQKLEEKAKRAKAKAKKKRERDLAVRKAAVPIRSSKRLRAIAEEVKESEESESEDEGEVEDGTIHYDLMPIELNELDDEEFQCFLLLRAWRVRKMRELELSEAYKIFPNRVLVEVIRRRRNDPKWAVKDREELQQCWGIGLGKMQSGIAVALMEEVETEEASARIEASRKLGSIVIKDEEEG